MLALNRSKNPQTVKAKWTPNGNAILFIRDLFSRTCVYKACQSSPGSYPLTHSLFSGPLPRQLRAKLPPKKVKAPFQNPLYKQRFNSGCYLTHPITAECIHDSGLSILCVGAFYYPSSIISQAALPDGRLQARISHVLKEEMNRGCQNPRLGVTTEPECPEC